MDERDPRGLDDAHWEQPPVDPWRKPPEPRRLRERGTAAWRRVRGGLLALWRPVEERPWLRRTLAAAGAVFLLLALLGGAAWQSCGFAGCPDPARLAAYRPGGAPLLLDRHGQVIATLLPDEQPEVRLRSLPAYVPAAFVAIEDRRFFEHGAVDWRRAVGALAANLRARAVAQGFSTITMQLARNLFPEEIPGRERTIGRKLIEIRVAQQLEARFSKPEILELYLNHIYFGNGAYGIEAAAWHYFHQPATRLTLAQAALLAALPKAPTRYDPRRHPGHARDRRNLVLASMAAQRRTPDAGAAAAAREPLGVRPPPPRPRTGPLLARYFVEEMRRQLEERFGDSIYNRPVRVWTTLDLTAQRAAEEELEHELRAIEDRRPGRTARHHPGGAGQEEDAPAGGDQELEGAVVTLAAQTGDVLAWVGGRDYAGSPFDRVANAHRQAGSAWKPFVYAAALARGVPLSQLIADTPLVVPLAGGGSWEPRNYDGSFDGRVTLREALARSKNVPTVRLAAAVGYGNVADLAASDGVPADMPLLPSMALGTVAVSPLRLTAAYTAFASLGWRASPRLLLRVDSAGGTPLWTAPPPSRRQVLSPAVAYLLDDALRDALTRGSGAPGLPPGFAGRAAGKTGTSTAGNDVWFIGFTTEVVTGVWIGYDEPRPIADQATGGRLAAPVFRRLMSRIYAGRTAPAWWPQPAGVGAWPVDRASGLVLAPGCAPAGGEPAAREIFLVGHEPMSTCPDGSTAAAGLAASLIDMTPSGLPQAGTPGDGGPADAEGAAGPSLAEGATGPSAGAKTGGQAAGATIAGRAGAAGRAAEADPADAADAVDAAEATPYLAAPAGGGSGAGRSGGPGTAAERSAAGGPAPGEGTGETAGATANLSGWWDVTTVSDASTGGDRSLRLTYRVALRQEGGSVLGEGESWEQDGSPVDSSSRSHIELSGTRQGREIRLRFTERGPGRVQSGTIFWRLDAGGDDLHGTFTAAATDAHGVTSAVRLR